MFNELSRLEVEVLKEEYPPGTKVRCNYMADSLHPVPPGTIGRVIKVDDAGQIHCAWENGSSLALVPGEDSFKKIGTKQMER